jgi:hypothetical protein
MATNRDLLKEAIADAKAVKEMAIANAKMALEEAFTPQLKSMLAIKLQEMEDGGDEYDMMGEEEEEYNELEEDFNLEELLAELNEAEDEEDMEDEADEAEEDMESETEEESMDLEDMSEEDLKSFIEDVIADMVEAGELEAGEDMEGEEMEDEEEESEEEEEVNIDELLAEIDSMDEMYHEDEMMEEEDEEMVGEIFGMFKKLGKEGIEAGTRTLKDFYNNNKEEIDQIGNLENGDEKKRLANGIVKKWFKFLPKMDTGSWRSDNSLLQQQMGLSSKGGNMGSAAGGLFENLQKELDEAYLTVETLRSELNEVNLLNAKLLYTNKIFKGKNLTESQKVKVLNSFDKTTTVKEVKLVYETLNEGITTSKKSLSENLGSASKAMGTTKKPIIEANDAFSRMREIAFYSAKH